MKRSLLILFFLFNIPLIYSAEIATTNLASEPIEKDLDKSEKNDSSLSNRKNINYQIAFAFIGMEYSTPGALTWSLGYFANEKDQLLLRYTIFRGVEGHPNLWIVAAGDRHYFVNSFNVMGSLFYAHDKGEEKRTQTTITSKALGLSLRVGNEWQWKNFTMGCDWFGIDHTVSHSQKKSILNSTTTTENRELSLGFTLTNFYLGYSF